jgi:hypothetical protein
MSEALFRYYLLASRRDRSVWHRLFDVNERLSAAGLLKLKSTAAIRVDIATQYRKTTSETVMVPASRRLLTPFFDHPEPELPSLGAAEARTEVFPLRSSLLVTPCALCGGGGRTECLRCHGTGQSMCEGCDGTGIVATERCAECDGQTRAPCRACNASGEVAHSICQGEGALASWTQTIVHHIVLRRGRTCLPSNLPSQVATAVETWREQRSEGPVALTAEALQSALGYYDLEVDAVLRSAQALIDEGDGSAGEKAGEKLHAIETASVIPLSTCRTISERHGRWEEFWLVGRGGDALGVSPRARLDPWKVAALPAAMMAVISWFWRDAEIHPSWNLLTLLTTLGFTVAAMGLIRAINGSGQEVPLVAVLPCSGQPTKYLTCLAATGALSGEAEYLDHAHRASVNALMGTGERPAQFQSAALRTRNGTVVRLIEVPAASLSPADWSRMGSAVTGIIYLEEPGYSGERFRELLRAHSRRLPPEAVARINAVELQSDGAGRNDEGASCLEPIRLAFIRSNSHSLDWSAVFHQLWQPIDSVLRRPLLARALRRRKGGIGFGLHGDQSVSAPPV